MNSKILHFVLINICFIAFSCISDKYKETSVVPKKSSYSAATQTIEDVVVDFSNGSNEKYIMTFAMSGSQSDTSVAIILSTDKNVAKIKHTTNGSRNLVISYYAKGQIVSKDSVDIITSGGGANGKIYFLSEYQPYTCTSNGSDYSSFSNSLYISSDLSCLDYSSKNVLYKNSSYLYLNNVSNNTSINSKYIGSFNTLYTNKNGYICVDYSTNDNVYIYNNNLSSLISNVSLLRTGGNMISKYLNSYTSSTNLEYATISNNIVFYSSYINYEYFIDYYKSNVKTSIYTKNFKNSYSYIKNVKISPNGKYVSFLEYDGIAYKLQVYNISTKVTNTVYSNTSYPINSYSFSPDDSKIVFSVFQSNSNSYDLLVYSSTGSGISYNITSTSNIDETSVDWK